MERLVVTMQPLRQETRLLAMAGKDEVMRAVLGPAVASHPRAAPMLMEALAPDGLLPPQLVGLGAAIFGMVAGSLAPQVLGGRGHPEVVDEAVTGRPAHAHGHGHAHAKGHAAGSQTGV